MIGNNTLRLNEDTVNLAIEEYLNRRSVATAYVKVTSTVQRETAGTPFDVEIEEHPMRAQVRE